MRCNSYLILKLALVAVAACLSACPGDKPRPPGLILPPPPVIQPPPPPPATQQLFIRREWRFQVFHNPDLPFEDVRPIPDGGSMTYGVLDDFVDFGKTQYSLPFEDPNSNAHVFSNETGKTFWVYTRAPRASPANDFANGAHAAIRQYMHFRKNAANATYRQVISQVWLEAVDGNPLRPLECLRHPARHCPALRAEVAALVWASREDDLGNPFFDYGNYAVLTGVLMDWKVIYQSDTPNDYVFEPDTSGAGVALAPRVRLTHPVVLDIPLDSVPVGGDFWVMNQAWSEAWNDRGGESTISAYYRDPVSTNGVTIETTGLEQIPEDRPSPTLPEPARVTVCSGGTNPAAGTLHIADTELTQFERGGRSANIVIERVGGTQGAVGAVVRTTDGTATAGGDYKVVEQYIRFEDGRAGFRVVRVPILADDEVESDETFHVSLVELGGCAATDADTAEVMILDDDTPPPVAAHHVGGKVDGLAGSGFKLLLNNADQLAVNANGVFQFPTDLRAGDHYDITVQTQPNAPSQICSVSNGSGVVADADIDSAFVSCVTPAPSGSLDAGFAGGKVALGIDYYGAEGAALQADGKIVLVGSMRIARYNPDGALDTTFGGDGEVEHQFDNGSADSLRAVAVQPDGRIVVAGTAGKFNSGDFALARYNADGTLDTSFGKGGVTYTDFGGDDDKAFAIAIDSSNRILLAGQATVRNGAAFETWFALARYGTTGAIDSGFGTNGKAMLQLDGTVNLALAMALQPDGRIVLAGKAARGPSADPDFGVARFNGDGTVDGTFGRAGAVTMSGGPGNQEEARDVAVQPDGRIVVTGLSTIGGSHYSFTTTRLNSDGTNDATFGTGGVVATALTDEDDAPEAMVLQPDGRIVVAGRTALSGSSDFALVRYLPGGALDTTFGDAGRLVVDFFGDFDRATSLLLQPDGRLIAAGFARSGQVSHAAMVRVNP